MTNKISDYSYNGISKYIVNGNINLYAKWEINTYTVGFNVDGGSSVAAQSVKYLECVIKPSNPTKSGYVFAGWYKDINKEELFNFNTKITSNINIYAKWKEKENIYYEVKFDLLGHGNNIASQSIIEGGKVTKPTDPSAEGYVFAGWYQDNLCNNVWNFNADTVIEPTTLYAKWKAAVVFEVLYNGKNIGATKPQSQEIVNTTIITLPNTTATGYVFNGWYKEVDLTTFVGNGGVDGIQIDGPTTFYAKWTPITYTIKYNLNGGSITNGDTAEKTYDTSLGLETPTKTGYKFEGWYKESSFKTVYDGTIDLSTIQNDEKNIYAKWSAITYTIKYNVDGIGTAPANKTKIYNTNITLSNPTNIPTG